MNNGAVSQLYDRLCRFESRRDTASAYPVHKRLAFDGNAERDIYDWIVDAVKIRDGANILDAGCGVGFGTLRLAAAGNVRVTGISVSPRELETAKKCAERYSRESAQQTDVAGRAVFQQGSFDEPGNQHFDLIVAVESLKHSPDIAQSLRQLSARLADNGELVVVEDIFSGGEHDDVADCLKNAWHLAELHRLDRYTAVLDDCETVDLTHAMQRRAPRWNRIRYFALGALSALPGEWGRIVNIFRGGVALECLYDRDEMRYLVIRYKKRGRLPS